MDSNVSDNLGYHGFELSWIEKKLNFLNVGQT